MTQLLASRVVSWTAYVMLCAMGAALLLAPSLVAAGEDPVVRFLNVPAGTDGTMTYSVTPGVDLPLPFTAPQESPFEFYLSPFLGEHGDVLSVQPSIAGLPGTRAKDQRLSFVMDHPVMTLQLKVPTLPTTGKYTGSLVVLQEGKVRQTNRLVLNRALAQRPAKVIVDSKSNPSTTKSGPPIRPLSSCRRATPPGSGRPMESSFGSSM